MSPKFVLSVVMSLTLFCVAQGENQVQMPAKPSAKQLAEGQAKKLRKELQLTDKQYKKVYSLCLQEQRLRENSMSGGPMAGRPDGAGPGGPGMGGPGQGGPGMGGRGMGGPGQGGPGMGGPGQGGPGMGRNGGDRPQMGAPNDGPGMGDKDQNSELQKFQEKKEKKMRKILTQQQYSIWEAQETRRIMEQSPLDVQKDQPVR